MSLWAELEDRSSGDVIRKEDFILCDVEVHMVGNGRKAPKWLAVPDDVRVQQFTVLVRTPNEIIRRMLPLAWSYKVGERNVEEFYQVFITFLNEAGDITCDSNERIGVTEESEQKLLDLRDRVAKHNEGVSGKPFWSVDPFCRDSQP